MQEIEAACRAALERGDPAAHASLEQLRSTAQGAQTCLALATTSSQPNAVFFAFQSLQLMVDGRMGAYLLEPHERAALHAALLAWWPQSSAAAREPLNSTRLAVLLTALLRVDYPAAWPSAFSDLIGVSACGPHGVDLLLRFSNAIDDDLVASGRNAQDPLDLTMSAGIKDAMRASNDVAEMLSTLFRLVSELRAPAPALSVRALEAAARYFSWADIGFAMAPETLSLLVAAVGDATLRTAACKAFTEIVSKGMPDGDKLQVLQRLVEAGAMSPGPAGLQPADLADDSFGAAFASLASAMAQQVLTCASMESAPAAVAQLLDPLMQIVLTCVAHPDLEVSEAGLQAVVPVVTLLKRQAEGRYGTLDLTPYAPRVLVALGTRAQVPQGFTFDPQDEDEAEIEQLRRQVFGQLKNITRANPDMVVQYLLSLLHQNMASGTPEAIEAMLQILYYVGEGMDPASRDAVPCSAPVANFAFIVSSVHEAPMLEHPHPEVLLRYYDICLRFPTALKVHHAERVGPVLQALVTEKGLRHPSAKVRSRSAYVVSKLTKLLDASVRPFISDLLQLLSQFLSISLTPSAITFEDQLSLFETVALLASASQSVTDKGAILQLVLAPQLARLAALCSEQAVAADAEAVAEEVCRICHALAQLSKIKGQLTADVATGFGQVAEVSLRCLFLLPTHDKLRGRVLSLWQRVTEFRSLDPAVLPLFPPLLQVTVAHSANKDFRDVLTLVVKMVRKCGAPFAPALDGALVPIVTRLYELLPALVAGAGDAPLVDEQDERRELQNAFYTCFRAIVVDQGVNAVLYSATNAHRLGDLLGTLADGISSAADAVLVKTCLETLESLCQQWLAPENAEAAAAVPAEARSVLMQFAVQQATPAMLSVPQGSHFLIHDINCQMCVRRTATIMLQLKAVDCASYGDFLSQYLTAQQCPPASIQTFGGFYMGATTVDEMMQALAALWGLQ